MNERFLHLRPIEGGDNGGEIHTLCYYRETTLFSLPYGFQVREPRIDVIGDCVFCFHHQVISV
jgi:hypothetical protein